MTLGKLRSLLARVPGIKLSGGGGEVIYFWFGLSEFRVSTGLLVERNRDGILEGCQEADDLEFILKEELWRMEAGQEPHRNDLEYYRRELLRK